MAGTAMRTAKKTSVGFGYYALAGGVACVGFVFLSIAAYSLLLETFTAAAAAGITGAGVMFISLSIAAFGHYRLKAKKIVKKPVMDGGFIDSIESTIKSALDGFEEPIKDNPKMALLLAALAGFAAGDQIGERNIH